MWTCYSSAEIRRSPSRRRWDCGIAPEKEKCWRTGREDAGTPLMADAGGEYMRTENMTEQLFDMSERVETLEDALEWEKGRAKRAANSICGWAEFLLLFSGAMIALTVMMLWNQEFVKALITALGAGMTFFASRLVRSPSLTDPDGDLWRNWRAQGDKA